MTRARSRKAHEARSQRKAATHRRNKAHGYKPRRGKAEPRPVVQAAGPHQSWIDLTRLGDIVKRLTTPDETQEAA